MIFDRATGRVEHRFDGHENGVSAVAWSSDGQHVASASFDASVIVRCARTGRVVDRLALDSIDDRGEDR